ncbi:hypothetical protein DPMN_035966 [Dreissena polymorpha]|uniref:Uncharacterized protein n=1 Tax=Dreissena polymorpha TaxID=45954 RepID=A0A9D4RLI7_DREPO|nr:hypothetical protein DPMN_035966 [Dreissena polymorpha]
MPIVVGHVPTLMGVTFAPAVTLLYCMRLVEHPACSFHHRKVGPDLAMSTISIILVF